MRALLDPEYVRPRLAGLPALCGGAIDGAALVSQWIKPGRYFNTHYRFDRGGTPAGRVSAFLLGAKAAARIVAGVGPHRPAVEPGVCPHCGVARIDGDVLLQRFPLDYRLPTLAACLDAKRVSAALSFGAPVVDLADVGYRPGMRCQIRYVFADGAAAFGKVAVERAPGRAMALQRRLYADAGGFGVSEPALYVPDLGLSVARAARGSSLHDLLRQDLVSPEEMAQVARSLAALHAMTPSEVDKLHQPEDEVRLVRDWTDLVSTLFPALAPDLAAATEAIAAACPAAGRAARRFIHRDFHDKQVLLGAPPVFLDLDTACFGDAETDLGNFAAHMILRDLQWRGRGRCAALADAFLSAYPGPIEPSRVAWYRRATLLRLACVYAVRPGGRDLSQPLIAEACA